MKKINLLLQQRNKKNFIFLTQKIGKSIDRVVASQREMKEKRYIYKYFIVK